MLCLFFFGAALRELQTLKGLALGDILQDVSKLIGGIKLPAPVRAFLLEKLSDIEYVHFKLFEREPV